MNPKIESDV